MSVRRILMRLPRAVLCASLALSVGFSGVWPGDAYAADEFVIRDIRIVGVQRTEIGTVFGTLPVKPGDVFTEDVATEAVRHLYATGFFSDVRIETDGDVMIVVVQESPVIASITFNGMREFDTKAITDALKQVGFGEGRIFDRAMLAQAELELKQQYLSKGKYGVEVTATVTPLPRNRMGVAFDIYEGEVAKIRAIRIIGARAFKESTLLDLMQLTTPGWMTWYTDTDKYSREKLEGDVEALRSHYLDRGYLEVVIEPPQVTISPDRRDIYITLTVQEGEPYVVNKVLLAGELLGLDQELNALITQKTGQPFSAERTNETARAISEYLGNLGYAFANVNPNPVLDRDTHEAVLTFYVDPGRRVYVRRIDVGGNVRTRDVVIRREMTQQESAWYDGNEIRKSRDRIDRLGYFNEVNVSTEPVPGTTDQIDVNVDVTEKPTGLLNFGIGYGSSERAILSAGISEENAFGSGHALTLQFNTSKINRSLVFAHTDPYWTRDGISRTDTVYYRQTEPFVRDDGDYRVEGLGAGMSFGVPISEYDRVFVGATFERNTIKTYAFSPKAYTDFIRRYGKTSTALIGSVGWSKDTRDSAVAPTRGYYSNLHADVSNMDLKYYLLSAQQQYYWPLSRDYTLAFNGMFDYGRGYGGRGFPVIKNVYAGGMGTVRGFESSSLGARDTRTGDYLGGAKRIVGTMQLYLPMPGASRDRTLRWFVFADAGQVYADGQKLDVGDLRYSAGLGLSWNSPMGPLQLSFARPLNKKKGDDTQAFQFQIGTAF